LGWALLELAALGVASINAGWSLPQQVNPQGKSNGHCVVIDNDYDIDDMMAMPMVIANQYVAAIVQTEGYTIPTQVAPAVDALVNPKRGLSQIKNIPILVGGQQASTPNGRAWPWLPFFRAMMNRSNGLLSNPAPPWRVDADYPGAVARAVAHCTRVSVLLTAPFTSFIHYAPLIKEKLDRIVITGRRISHDSRMPSDLSFNCRYDISACQAAMSQLANKKAFFVDLPHSNDCHTASVNPGNCYSPSYVMVAGVPDGMGRAGGVVDQGLAGRLKRALINKTKCDSLYTTPATMGRPCSSLSTWEPAAVSKGPGGHMLLWDEATAIFLLDPARFAAVGLAGHPFWGGQWQQPRLVNGSHLATTESLRAFWTDWTNRAAKFP
jgi:hypothetical protein